MFVTQMFATRAKLVARALVGCASGIWVQCISDKGEATAVRAHGLQLQPRWSGIGKLPVHTVPPFRGAPAFEVSHPFHIKMSPGIYLGPRCNHDLGVLLRFPTALPAALQRGSKAAEPSKPAQLGAVSTRSSGSAPCSSSSLHGTPVEAPLPVETPEDVQELADRLLEDLINSEFYCSVYASKDAPHIEGLLVTLAHGVRALDEEIARGGTEGHDMTPQEKSRRLLNRLLSSTTRRMHKGYPEMLTYLLQKPSWYCSHQFVTLSTNSLFDHCTYQVARLASHMQSEAAHTSETSVSDEPHGIDAMGKCAVPKHPSIDDYRFRSVQLDAFPLYYLWQLVP